MSREREERSFVVTLSLTPDDWAKADRISMSEVAENPEGGNQVFDQPGCDAVAHAIYWAHHADEDYRTKAFVHVYTEHIHVEQIYSSENES